MFATQDGLLQNDYALRDHHDDMDRAGSAELGRLGSVWLLALIEDSKINLFKIHRIFFL